MKDSLTLIEDLTPTQIASICDHTFLNRSEAYRKSAGEGESPVQLRAKAFCAFMDDTIANKERLPYAVCVRPEDVNVTITYLSINNHKDIVVASVVGFPDGSLYDTEFKVVETVLAIENGAKEIDMVLDYGRLKLGISDYVRRDVESVVDAAHEHDALVKLIFETSELNADQIKRVCAIAREQEVDFIKTSTGFGAYGAKAEDLEIMRANFNGGIKISGGVNPDNVRDLLYAASGRQDGYIDLTPNLIRIGESSLLTKL